MDTRSPEQRRKIMQAVGTKNTGPELVVRKSAHKLGFRYSLHRKDLPGKPDLVFRSRRKVIFVHGCFWHGHGCEKGKLPKSKLEYWAPKIHQNRLRDRRNMRTLRKNGWSVLVIWQCQTKSLSNLEKKLQQFLEAKT